MSLLLAIFITLGIWSAVKIIINIIIHLIKYSNKNFEGITTNTSIVFTAKDGIYFLPTVKVWDLSNKKFLEISFMWLCFEYYICYRLSTTEDP